MLNGPGIDKCACGIPRVNPLRYRQGQGSNSRKFREILSRYRFTDSRSFLLGPGLKSSTYISLLCTTPPARVSMPIVIVVCFR
jgi:hypothetical protein